MGDLAQPEPSRLHSESFPGYRPGREHFLARPDRAGKGAAGPPEAKVGAPGVHGWVEWELRGNMTSEAAKDPHYARTRASA